MLPICICVPLRNEEAELPGLFRALDRLERSPGDRVRLCLLLDGCTDASGRIAHRYRERRGDVLVEEAAPGAPNAGRARHRAMALGLLALGDGDGLLLTTDADSRPTPNWLTAMAAALEQADVVTGRIARIERRPSGVQDRLEAYYDALFALRRALDPVPWEAARTHHYAGGANIGLHAAAYRAIGGFRPLASGEDARLVDDAARLGFRVRRDASSIVWTSDRREGRAPGGLATALRGADGEPGDTAVRVAHPDDAAWQYRMHAAARAAHAGGRPDAVAAALGLTRDHLLGVARDCPNAEAFAMRIVPSPPGGMRAVSLAVAEAELARLTGGRLAA